jgi:hypothetical protein
MNVQTTIYYQFPTGIAGRQGMKLHPQCRR